VPVFARLRESIRDQQRSEGKKSPAIVLLKVQLRSQQADLAALMEEVKDRRQKRLVRYKAALQTIESRRADSSSKPKARANSTGATTMTCVMLTRLEEFVR
jgi:hypothetical protein